MIVIDFRIEGFHIVKSGWGCVVWSIGAEDCLLAVADSSSFQRTLQGFLHVDVPSVYTYPILAVETRSRGREICRD